jgi:hypothetical protein
MPSPTVAVAILRAHDYVLVAVAVDVARCHKMTCQVPANARERPRGQVGRRELIKAFVSMTCTCVRVCVCVCVYVFDICMMCWCGLCE